MKQHTIIGMAGHIDHGKTALIKALTGIETDRLPEEKKRGITIDIGFAYWQENVTIIDVPGHEKFVHNMVAGVSTVDLFMLVIAADDGVMPQTIEHLDILKFFGAQNGLVALTKIDLVDHEWRALVRDEVRQFLKEKGFANIPIMEVSAVSGEGIEALRTQLLTEINKKASFSPDRPFRLNVDRSFSVKGYGQVVTGTVLSAAVSNADAVMLLPEGITGKVRGVQVHQHAVQQAFAGQRAALNIGGIEKNKLFRGVTLVQPESLKPTFELLAEITTTDYFNFKVKRHSNVRIHLGAGERNGRIDWFEDENYLHKNTAYHLRVKFNEAAVCAPDDAILLRSISPVTTIAGGRVLQINPPKLKRQIGNRPEYFRILIEGNLADKLALFFENPIRYRTFTLAEIQQNFFETQENLQKALHGLIKKKRIKEFRQNNQSFFYALKAMERLIATMVEKTEKFLQENTLRPGMNRNEMLASLEIKRIASDFFEKALQRAVNSGALLQDGDLYLSPGRAKDRQAEQLLHEISAAYLQGNFSPPSLDELADKFKLKTIEIKTLCQQLVKRNELKSVSGKFYLHVKTMNRFLAFLRSYFEQEVELDVAAVKAFTDSSRKFIIPLLEEADQNDFTRRNGDVRSRGSNL